MNPEMGKTTEASTEGFCMADLTEISKSYYKKALGRLTEAETMDMLDGGFALRPLSDKIKLFAGCDDGDTVKKTLETALNQMGVASADSVRKNVSNWMKPGTVSIAKKSALQIAFALGLNSREADAFLAAACGEALHWRDPEEIIAAYALDDGMGYADMLKLRDDILPKLHPVDEREAPEGNRFTEIVKNMVRKADSVETLTEVLIDQQENLGKLHNTAYRDFMKMVDQLSQTDEVALSLGKTEAQASYGTRDILEHYLFDREIAVFRAVKGAKKESREEERILQSILSDWPNETTFSRMKNRKTDVTRKVMILLDLATCSVYSDDDTNREIWEAKGIHMDRQRFFNLHRQTMDRHLIAWGFAPLDVRAPFDWMVLCCLRPEENGDTIAEPVGTMAKMLKLYTEVMGKDDSHEE